MLEGNSDKACAFQLQQSVKVSATVEVMVTLTVAVKVVVTLVTTQ